MAANQLLAALIREVHPGKHFIGLWVYRQHNVRKRPPKWVVTFFDHKGQYWETHLHRTPVAALRECHRILRKRERKP